MRMAEGTPAAAAAGVAPADASANGALSTPRGEKGVGRPALVRAASDVLVSKGGEGGGGGRKRALSTLASQLRPVGRRSEQLDASAELLIQRGHDANRRGEFVEARSNFRAAFELSSKAAAQISAANMTLKIGDVAAAIQEYTTILERQDLAETHREAVLRKVNEATHLQEASR